MNAEMCSGCAFRDGTDANRAEHTVMLARLCVDARDPFMCHEDGHVCRGWVAAVKAADEQPEWKRAVSQVMADEYAEALNELAMGHRIDEAAVIARINRRIRGEGDADETANKPQDTHTRAAEQASSEIGVPDPQEA